MPDHLTIARNTESGAVTVFNNMPFDFACNFKGKTLFANATGLYEYGGASDNGYEIVTSIKTDKSNQIMGQGGLVNSQHRKRIPTSNVYINAEATGTVTLNVTQDDTAPLSYPDATVKTGLAVRPVSIGRGVDFVHLQLEVIGCDKIESIEYEPETIRRRAK
jgi:hypothetical protein